ncbi:MAG TPA: hypothetical protein VFS31_17430 [Chitinophagaceae bacterium]|jgi:hypothetical protein|nr:hypothetical protein [Chitinophagaceae bacterium]
MKKLWFIILFAGLFQLPVLAQNNANENDGGRIEALKIAYLTRKLNLSAEEAQKFWPIYNQYSKEIRAVQLEARNNQDNELKKEEKILEIRKKFNGEFAKALSMEKINMFFRAEKDFGDALRKELMERRQQRLDNRRPRLRQN